MTAPLLFLLSFAAQSFTNAIVACAIFFVLWLIYTLYLFRRRIFKKHYADKPPAEWTEEIPQEPVGPADPAVPAEPVKADT